MENNNLKIQEIEEIGLEELALELEELDFDLEDSSYQKENLNDEQLNCLLSKLKTIYNLESKINTLKGLQENYTIKENYMPEQICISTELIQKFIIINYYEQYNKSINKLFLNSNLSLSKTISQLIEEINNISRRLIIKKYLVLELNHNYPTGIRLDTETREKLILKYYLSSVEKNNFNELKYLMESGDISKMDNIKQILFPYEDRLKKDIRNIKKSGLYKKLEK